MLILLVTSVKYFKFLSFGNKKNSHSSSADVRDRGFPTITITVTGAAWVFQATFTLQVVLRQLFYIIVKIWVQCKQSSTLKWPIHTAQGVTSRTVVTELNIDATRQILHACVSIWKSFFKHRQSPWSLYQPAHLSQTARQLSSHLQGRKLSDASSPVTTSQSESCSFHWLLPLKVETLCEQQTYLI